ncbi:hypothetical protein LIU_01875 [Enterococcus durans]|nr:hypothetical protein LIANG_06955 [Enterococcus durans]AKZ47328.1 hypothetical protein LIU_01875 [Enterococcus durans]
MGQKSEKMALYFLMLVNFANIFFCIKKYRKDTLKSFRINLANKFIGGFKISHTQLIKDTLNILDLNIYFEENCLTKEKYKGQICLIYKGTLLYKPEEWIGYN